MAAKSKKGSTPRSFSRPDSEIFSRSPLAQDAGRVVCLDQFVAASTVADLLDECKDEEVFQACMTVLFYVYDPRSMFRNMPEEERFQLVLKNNVTPELQAVASKFIKKDSFAAVRRFYLGLITTPSERLHLALSKQVNVYAERVSEMDITASAGQGKEILDAVGFAQDSAIRLKALEATIREEAKSRARSNYASKLFELKKETNP